MMGIAFFMGVKDSLLKGQCSGREWGIRKLETALGKGTRRFPEHRQFLVWLVVRGLSSDIIAQF